MPSRIHDDEVAIDPASVRHLLDAQFPRWSGLPITPVRSSGTDHAIFRLGDRYGLRLPRVPWAAATLEREYAWLPKLAPDLPVDVPTPLALGEPGPGIPWPWTVFHWVEGDNPAPHRLSSPDILAEDLARFIEAMRALDPAGAPPTVWTRPLHEEDDRVRTVLPGLGGRIDIGAIRSAWREALEAHPCGEHRTWIHGDLAPGNLLLLGGRLHGVIDFGAMGVGDPASDLRPAWNLLPPAGRLILRERLGVDDAQWARGRGWTLLQAVAQLGYFGERDARLAANAEQVLAAIVAEVRAGA